MVTTIFYDITDRENVLNKNLNVSRETLNGLIYNDFNKLYLNLRIKKTSEFNYNYCYITELNRYFFIENVKTIDNNYLELSLKIDVLMTYKEKILNCSGLVVSRENANNFISTRDNIKNIIPNFEKIDFPNNHFSNNNENIILITIKGN